MGKFFFDSSLQQLVLIHILCSSSQRDSEQTRQLVRWSTGKSTCCWLSFLFYLAPNASFRPGLRSKCTYIKLPPLLRSLDILSRHTSPHLVTVKQYSSYCYFTDKEVCEDKRLGQNHKARKLYRHNILSPCTSYNLLPISI